MTNQQVYQRQIKLVRIDAGLHKMLKIQAASQNTTVRAVVEGVLSELLGVRTDENYETLQQKMK